MKFVKHIAAILFGVIFLISSSGFMIYKSHCSCTGNKQVTVFVTPETCESEPHQHNNHDNKGDESSCSDNECESCPNHTEDCGCYSPEATYLKLNNQVINEEIKFIESQPIQIFIAFHSINIHILDELESVENYNYYVDPPPIFISSLDFLIHIQQLQISLIA